MRATRAEINSKNLIFNLHNIQKTAPNSEILAMVKANAYGHGALEIAPILRANGVNYLGVAFANEGVSLRKSGDSGEIVVIIPATKAEADDLINYNLQTCVADNDVLLDLSEKASQANKTIKVHIFINTGMNRDGLKPDDAEEFINNAKKLPGIELIAIMTHFASSDFSDKSFAHKQLNDFKELIHNLQSNGHYFKYVHAANSGAVANIPDSHFNMVRPGISMYGYMPEEKLLDNIELKPILELKTVVLSIKNLKVGETAGYSFKYFAKDNTQIAIIPIGYGDGLNYGFTNKAKCLIQGEFYPLVGSICMDQSIVEIGNDTNIKVGDEVVIIGSQGAKLQNAYHLSRLIQTIPYDITTSISMRVPRIII